MLLRKFQEAWYRRVPCDHWTNVESSEAEREPDSRKQDGRPYGTPLMVVLSPAHAHVHTCRHSSCIHTYTHNHTLVDSDTCTETLTIYTFSLYFTYSWCSCGIVMTTCQSKIIGQMSLLFPRNLHKSTHSSYFGPPLLLPFFSPPLSPLFAFAFQIQKSPKWTLL